MFTREVLPKSNPIGTFLGLRSLCVLRQNPIMRLLLTNNGLKDKESRTLWPAGGIILEL